MLRMLNKKVAVITAVLIIVGLAGSYYLSNKNEPVGYGAPPYLDELDEAVPEAPFTERYPDFSNWKRPNGPYKVGLQVGHWKSDELPDELERLRTSSGTRSGSIAEWEVNLRIAEETKLLLEQEGIVVDILPATVPKSYWADAFVAIHADGSEDYRTSGFKVAAPRRDLTHRSDELVQILEEEYEKVTNLPKDPNISRNMTGYYAFSWRRHEHAIHPMTTAVILETGFLTNPHEAKMLINDPSTPAKAIAQALVRYLNAHVVL
jgi:N-acetylmuramoyl-L-alanine amidase